MLKISQYNIKNLQKLDNVMITFLLKKIGSVAADSAILFLKTSLERPVAIHLDMGKYKRSKIIELKQKKVKRT